MAFPKKDDRNKDLVKKRNEGWSFRQLAQYFNIDVRAAWEIYNNNKDLLEKEGSQKVQKKVKK